MANSIKEQLGNLPRKPGVYLFKNLVGTVLYVGKAKVLANRVRSYFQLGTDLSEAKQIMIRQATTIDFIEVATEIDALVLEDQLIKDYQPRFNILAKDDKGFLYIHITAETFPRVLAVRRPDLREPGIYYGPYPFARNLRDVLKLLHMIFPFRTCATLPKRACLEFYLGNCTAPCIQKISVEDYRKLIDQVIQFFEGKAVGLTDQIETNMLAAAEQQHFEQAARLRNQLSAVKRLASLRKTPQKYLAGQLAQKAINPQQGLQELAQALELPTPPHRVEVYDISHQQGSHIVGSMIVFTDGLPDKAEYRRFKIKTVFGQSDDFKCLREVVTRRIKRDWPLPDLAIMDGGKGQLSAVAALWELVGVNVVSLAKKREELFKPNNPIPVTLPNGSQGLFIVQRMRDEAHRFAITYYRLLHNRTMRSNLHK